MDNTHTAFESSYRNLQGTCETPREAPGKAIGKIHIFVTTFE
jgi:hypothetical protein